MNLMYLIRLAHIEKHLIELGIISLQKRYHRTVSWKRLQSLAKEKPDFVFNLVESINNKGELIYFVPALLNMYSIPYSGNSLEAIFLTSNKTICSKTMKNAGINNPGIISPSQIKNLYTGRKYIVKPIWEDGSLGITAIRYLNGNLVMRKN